MPEVASLSWKEKIAAAGTTSKKFEALPTGRYLVEILEASVAVGPKGEYINVKTKVAEGPRANARVNTRTFPNAADVQMFIDFIKAAGLSVEWLMTEPTMEQITSALVGRVMSANVYIEKDAKDDNNGDKWRSLNGFKHKDEHTEDGNAAPAAAPAPAASNAGWGGQTAAPVAQPAPAAQAAPVADPGNPWGQPTTGAPANPFNQ